MSIARALIRARALVVAALFIPLHASAQPSEDAVKAAFLPKFARYVTWPAGATPRNDTPFVLCIIGPDPFGQPLETAAASETIDGHAVAVRRLATANGSGGSTAGCQLAFLSGGEKQVEQSIEILRRQAVLTVTDDRAGDAHGIIHFVLNRGRVRFVIDDAAAAARGLAINSRLLALALRVRQRP